MSKSYLLILIFLIHSLSAQSPSEPQVTVEEAAQEADDVTTNPPKKVTPELPESLEETEEDSPDLEEADESSNGKGNNVNINIHVGNHVKNQKRSDEYEETS